MPETIYRFDASILNLGRRTGLTTTLYFIAVRDGDDRLKIGIAQSMQARLRGYLLHNPDTIVRATRTIPRSLDRAIERMVHERLAEYAIGREWFRVDLATAKKVADKIITSAKAQLWRLEAGPAPQPITDKEMAELAAANERFEASRAEALSG